MGVIVGPYASGSMSISGQAPTDNLIFHLDVRNTAVSVPGDDNWYDMAQHGGFADASGLSYSGGPPATYTFDGTTTVAQFDVSDSVTKLSKFTDIWNAGATIIAWIKPTSDGEGSVGRIADKGSWYFYVGNETGGTVELIFNMIHATNNGNWETTTTMSTSAWHHVACSITALPVNNEDPALYIDGASAGANEVSTPTGAYSSDYTSDLYIGNNSGATSTFDGDICIVKIYNRVLTAAEILADYNSLRKVFQ